MCSEASVEIMTTSPRRRPHRARRPCSPSAMARLSACDRHPAAGGDESQAPPALGAPGSKPVRALACPRRPCGLWIRSTTLGPLVSEPSLHQVDRIVALLTSPLDGGR